MFDTLNNLCSAFFSFSSVSFGKNVFSLKALVLLRFVVEFLSLSKEREREKSEKKRA